ncbi:putative serine protease 45 [Petaurus breviceps papuanus]|uniref:putative serine protease 45 n=1 Tax=Petaurus breviceps papuanus TaxID=3040969 RepID=UPI0036DC4D6D
MAWAHLALLLSLLLQTDHAYDRDRDLYEVCGRPKLRPRDFAIEPRRGRWPWQASLRYKGKHWCGATLIEAQWMITAASCFRLSNNTRDYRVMIGSIYAYPTTRFLASFLKDQEHYPGLAKIYIRSDYAPYQFGDIALLKLNQKIPYRRHVSPVCVPLGPWELKSIRQCWITGWGKLGESPGKSCLRVFTPWILTDTARTRHLKQNFKASSPSQETGIYQGLWRRTSVQFKLVFCKLVGRKDTLEGSMELREARVKITDLDRCENVQDPYQSFPNSDTYRNDVLCILMPLYPAERCVGDQGGPLICRIQNVYYQFGIMNWDHGCMAGIKTKTFTSIALYSAWIDKVINSTTTLSPFKLLLLALLLPQALLEPF